MTDPLEGLRLPAAPADPDPVFAADLRARLARALLPPGGTMPTLSPYLRVADARRAVDWYARVFDGRPRGEPYVMPDGSIGHAEVAIGDAVLMLAEGTAPRPGEHAHTVYVEVTDADATLDRAVAEGAALERPAATQEYGRNGVVVDPFGHRWLVMTPVAAGGAAGTGERDGAGTPAARHGDVGYVSVGVPDEGRARAFYGAVLGWRFSPGDMPGGWEVEDRTPGVGMWGGQDPPEVQLCFRVDDVAAAVRAVRAAGGEAGDAEDRAYGLLADCRDDQGIRFQLWQPPSG